MSHELAAAYALGILDDPEELHAARALDLADVRFSAEVAAYREVNAELALLTAVAGPEAPPAARIVGRAIGKLPGGLAALVSPGTMEWKASGHEGVWAKKLFRDPAGNVSWLVKIDPGATYPRHRHTSLEHCLVLEGEVAFDEYVLRAGDYEAAWPETEHSAFRSPRGAVLFIIANQGDEVF